MGQEWAGMIGPLRILVVVGVAHAIVNVIGESLSGTGHIGFRARVNIVWMVGMVGALVVLVQADGIRGAALAHLALYVPVTIAYATTGMRLLGSEPRGLGTALRGVGLVVGLQTAVTFAGIALLLQLGVPELAGGLAAAALGLAAAAVVFAVRGRAAI
jgi:O-antigen/teichoic acid export membrane protein